MRIAVVGVGGPGKTSMSTLFASHLARSGHPTPAGSGELTKGQADLRLLRTGVNMFGEKVIDGIGDDLIAYFGEFPHLQAIRHGGTAPEVISDFHASQFDGIAAFARSLDRRWPDRLAFRRRAAEAADDKVALSQFDPTYDHRETAESLQAAVDRALAVDDGRTVAPVLDIGRAPSQWIALNLT